MTKPLTQRRLKHRIRLFKRHQKAPAGNPLAEETAPGADGRPPVQVPIDDSVRVARIHWYQPSMPSPLMAETRNTLI